MRRAVLWLPSVSLALLPFAFTGSPRPDARAVTVKMVDVSTTEFKYEPASVTLSPGDTLHFVQTGSTPHNVDFKATPAGADLGGAKMGPFLTAADQAYDLVLDRRFPAGSYQFACTPHESFGMKGTLIVQGQ